MPVVSSGKQDEAPFGVTWLYRSFLWLLFHLLLGLKKDSLPTYTSSVTVVKTWVTPAVPGFFSFTGYWRNTTTTVVLAVVGLTMAVGSWPLARRSAAPSRPAADVPAGPGTAGARLSNRPHTSRSR